MLTLIAVDEKEKWNQTVKSFNEYDVSYLNEYASAFQLVGEGLPILFYYDDGSRRAINVMLKRDIGKNSHFQGKLPLDSWFDFATPYGYGGFLYEGDNPQVVNKVYDTYCQENNIVSEFTRFHLIHASQTAYSGLIQTPLKNVIRSLDTPIEDIFMDFEQRVRKSIKKANRAQLEVQIDTDGCNLDEFLRIYYSTMERSGAQENFYFPRKFFEELNKLKGYYIYIHVLFEGKIVSSELVLYGNENAYSFLGGTDRAYYQLSANSFLKYEIIKWAKQKGLKRLILGGGHQPEDGIFKYKKGFAPTGIYNFYIGKKIFNEEKYQELVEIRSRETYYDKKTTYFPKYRGQRFKED